MLLSVAAKFDMPGEQKPREVYDEMSRFFYPHIALLPIIANSYGDVWKEIEGLFVQRTNPTVLYHTMKYAKITT
jgi:hypothetical protein